MGAHARLADRWSKTENVEWSREIPGRGWSSPIVTGGRVYVTTVDDGGQVEAAADRDGVQQRVRRGADETGAPDGAGDGEADGARHRAAEGGDAALLPLLPEPEDRQGGVAEGVSHGAAARRAPPQEQFHLGDPGDRREVRLRVRGESGAVGVRPEGQAGLVNAARSASDLSRLRDGKFARAGREPAGRS